MIQNVFTRLQNHDKNLYLDNAFNGPFLFIVCFENVLDSHAGLDMRLHVVNQCYFNLTIWFNLQG